MIYMRHDFRYISRKDPKLRDSYNNLMRLLQAVRNDLKEYTFQHKIIGSYSRNMVTYDAKSNTGFDFDVNIYPNDEKYSAEEIKRLFKKTLDKKCKAFGFDYAEDSTRVLTIKVKDRKNASVVYSVDFAFVYDYKDKDGLLRQKYIHFNKEQGSYDWRDQPNSYYLLDEKVRWIKGKGLWEIQLKPYYIEKKNNNNDSTVHSRTIFAISVNEICQKYGYMR